MGREFGLFKEITATKEDFKPVKQTFSAFFFVSVLNGFIQNFITNSIFSSGQAFAFSELMRRVQPQQDVKIVRDEIKVRKIERLSGNTTAVSTQNEISEGFLRLCFNFFDVLIKCYVFCFCNR